MNAGWPGAHRKTRCDYCAADPVVWAWYTTVLPYRGPYRASGRLKMNMAACAAHEGCVNWISMLDAIRSRGEEPRIERTGAAA